jgi:hypothetical protein
MEQSPPITEAKAPKKTLPERLDTAKKLENISHEEQAHRAGLGRSTYFEVKAGRGSDDAKQKAEGYLAKLPAKPSDRRLD